LLLVVFLAAVVVFLAVEVVFFAVESVFLAVVVVFFEEVLVFDSVFFAVLDVFDSVFFADVDVFASVFFAEVPVFLPVEEVFFLPDVVVVAGFSSSAVSSEVSVETRFIRPPKRLPKRPPEFELPELFEELEFEPADEAAFEAISDASRGAAAVRMLFVLLLLTPVSCATSFVVAEFAPKRPVIIVRILLLLLFELPVSRGRAAVRTLFT